ncbi:unnamed protein product [Didymodactylos carnosus]|uniref:Uncharacterized protein n=1 Tax=Didymodactylos carnosus TaxID=1234261 RepID=A0A814DHC0_9BILA|nr:unnamed protein product [Didymodactylos carnosus]CAF0957100.1 unnamed protein product [Didymodactylos carnosus]CAF3721897.1 unnamed protein product [Didymodactylos carnosus]CAF3732030.1 unnamed protein product [Didymodactylos carnosus]
MWWNKRRCLLLLLLLIQHCSSYHYPKTLLNLQMLSKDVPVSSISIANDTCSQNPINIDQNTDDTDHDVEQHDQPITSDTYQFSSIWEKDPSSVDNSEEDDDRSTIEIQFYIPYVLNDPNSILNHTIYIRGGLDNHLLSTITEICINSTSSFSIKYTTTKPLPHNICLYLVINVTTIREIFLCRTIDDTDSSDDDHASDNGHGSNDSHAIGPSPFFILSQCVIILIMMLIIYAVQTAREKRIFNRIKHNLMNSRPFSAAFRGDRQAMATAASRQSLQLGLRNFDLRNPSAVANALNNRAVPIEEQVLAANDLTQTAGQRKQSLQFLKPDLMDVKEFTKRMSETNENGILGVKIDFVHNLTAPWKEIKVDENGETIISNPVRCEHW